MRKFKILSTKQLEPLLIEKAKEDDIEIIQQDFIAIEGIWTDEKFTEIQQYLKKQYIAFTSANAVTILDDYLQANKIDSVNWKIFCLAGKTKRAVMDAVVLKNDILEEGRNAGELAQKIIIQGIREIVFFCGDKRREDLPAMLKHAGIKLHEVFLYRTIEMPHKIEDENDAVVFFSPSAVNSFFTLNQLNKNTVCFAIGQTTADTISEFTDNKIIVSESPDQEKLMETVGDYFRKIK
ncbi:MAG: uroporphyrinogen-III synthase, partial [Flavisolibacter sp.]